MYYREVGAAVEGIWGLLWSSESVAQEHGHQGEGWQESAIFTAGQDRYTHET